METQKLVSSPWITSEDHEQSQDQVSSLPFQPRLFLLLDKNDFSSVHRAQPNLFNILTGKLQIGLFLKEIFLKNNIQL